MTLPVDPTQPPPNGSTTPRPRHGGAARASGESVQADGEAAQILADSVQIPHDQAQIPNKSSKVSPHAVAIPGESAEIPRHLAAIPSESAGVSRDPAPDPGGPVLSMAAPTLFFAGQPGENFGWGICNQHLLDELSRRRPVVPLNDSDSRWNSTSLPGDLFTPLMDQDFEPATPARGRRNFAYTFFENELTERSVENARRFDLIFAGCSWCCQRMEERGIHNHVKLIQGVDAALFQPATAPPVAPWKDRFVLFSGGKFEIRKGQDLVLKAFQMLAPKYRDMWLINAWFNPWPGSVETMAASPHIECSSGVGSWEDQMRRLYVANRLPVDHIITLPLLAHEEMVQVYAMSHVGVFPNRCEGGTNLVLMEYMACGKPAIASFTSGHCDVVNTETTLLLRTLRPFNLMNPEGQTIARWEEPALDELVAQIEYAYHHREAVQALGGRGREFIRQFTWPRTAETLLATIDAVA